MTVLEYLKEKNIKTDVSILTLCEKLGKINDPIYIMPKEFRNIDKTVGNLEVMETVEEEDCLEMWCM